MIMIEGENWKEIVGYEGLYKISDKGRILSFVSSEKSDLEEGKLMKCPPNTYGNPRLNLSKDRIFKSFLVHRLVAIHFLENPENKTKTKRIDGNKLNNSAENIAWV